MTGVPYQSEARGTYRAAVEERHRQATPRQAMPTISGPAPGESRLTRRRRTSDMVNLAASYAPPGMSYEWKRDSVFAMKDQAHQRELRENHWTPVPADRHPELAFPGETVIRNGGDILMQRPQYLTDEAVLEQINDAMAPIKVTEDKLYGTSEDEARARFTRSHPKLGNRVVQQWSPGSPIEDGSLESEP